jgi:cytochrome b561
MIFGSYDLAFFTHNENLFSIVRNVHEFCTNAIIALIIIHILAALYHHFIVKDETTSNMAKFWTSKTQID